MGKRRGFVCTPEDMGFPPEPSDAAEALARALHRTPGMTPIIGTHLTDRDIAEGMVAALAALGYEVRPIAPGPQSLGQQVVGRNLPKGLRATIEAIEQAAEGTASSRSGDPSGLRDAPASSAPSAAAEARDIYHRCPGCGHVEATCLREPIQQAVEAADREAAAHRVAASPSAAAPLDVERLAAALMWTGHAGDHHRIYPLDRDHFTSEHPREKCDFYDEATGYAIELAAAYLAAATKEESG